jgi:hypothetical protein
MRQAITTKFLGPTNFRGSRVKATCQAKSITVSWDHALDTNENHREAALSLATLLGWSGTWEAGGLPDGTGNVYVLGEYGDGFTVAPKREVQP